MSRNLKGTLYGLGIGPGDPELITLKAYHLLRSVSVLAWPAPKGGESLVRRLAGPHLEGIDLLEEISVIMPISADRFPVQDIYDEAQRRISTHLDDGRDVAFLCQGDPFFYGSFMYLFERMAERYPVTVVPGVSSVQACTAALGMALVSRNDVLSVIPAPLEDETLRIRIESVEACAIVKLGRHLDRVRTLLARMSLMDNAFYAERVGMADERLAPLAEVTEKEAPYFSMALVRHHHGVWHREKR
ncbi:MAG: precorrin-2 C(20)-methyltransferase [Parvularculales bacterium]